MAYLSKAACVHCGQPAIVGAEFCCTGCQFVHGLIHSSALDRYYELHQGPGLPAIHAADARRNHPWLEPICEQLEHANELQTLQFDIQGVHCTACVWLIQQLFDRMPHGQQVICNPAVGQLTLTVAPSFQLRDWVYELERFGYRVGPIGEQPHRASRDLLIRMGICIALAINAMVLSATTYFGLNEGPLFQLFRRINYAAAFAAVFIGGWPFFQSAYASVRRRVIHFDIPIALGILLAFSATSIAFLTKNHQGTYDDSITVFVALMITGRWLRQRMLERNRQQLLADQPMEQFQARIVRNNQAVLIPAGQIRAGDILLMARGDVAVVDGTLCDSHGTFSLEWIDGESTPRVYKQADRLPAGAINVGAAVRLKAAVDYADSSLRGLLSSSKRKDGEHVPTPFWQRIGTGYVAAILALSVIAFLSWFFASGSIGKAIEVTTAVLVVSCPCAFGIAVPLAYEFAQSGLKRLGVFVATTDLFDRLPLVCQVAFDKTGTLTTGSLSLQEPERVTRLPDADKEILYNLCARSSHPKSAAVLAAFEDCALFRPDRVVTETPGCGLEVVSCGTPYRLGVAQWAITDPLDNLPDHDLAFTKNGKRILTLDFVETLRGGARQELQALSSAGYGLWIVSGDAPDQVATIADKVNLSPERAIGGLKPEGKAKWIAEHDRQNTLFVGDGINDSLIASAAFTSGTPAIDRPHMAARTDFYFVSAGLAPVRQALRVARAAARVVRRNLALSVTYNVVAVSLALAGSMRPWMAAILMPLSSISVTALTSYALSSRSALWRS